jgi:hypothetical protein
MLTSAVKALGSDKPCMNNGSNYVQSLHYQFEEIVIRTYIIRHAYVIMWRLFHDDDVSIKSIISYTIYHRVSS